MNEKDNEFLNALFNRVRNGELTNEKAIEELKAYAEQAFETAEVAA